MTLYEHLVSRSRRTVAELRCGAGSLRRSSTFAVIYWNRDLERSGFLTLPPPQLFVDGAFEPDPAEGYVGSIGGILLDPVDNSYSFFRAKLRKQHVEFLLGVAGKTAIFQLELLPVLIGRILWAEWLRNRSLICWCDNDAAKGALISGYSAQPLANKIISELAREDVAGGVFTWYDRVPTSSNPADAPSRLCKPEPLAGWQHPSEVDGKTVTDITLEELRIAAVQDLKGSEADPRCFSLGAGH